jgi:hypothetical protein
MRKGKQKKLPTPGTNRKAWISGALNFGRTGSLHWVVGARKKDSELFMKSCSNTSEGPIAAISSCT